MADNYVTNSEKKIYTSVDFISSNILVKNNIDKIDLINIINNSNDNSNNFNNSNKLNIISKYSNNSCSLNCLLIGDVKIVTILFLK